jgi:hypothetical protein
MISRGRKTLFLGITVLALFLFIEALSLVTYGIATGGMLSFAKAEAERQRVRDEKPAALTEPANRGPIPKIYVLHPYLGFVTRPSRRIGGSNGYGFLGHSPPFRVGRRDARSNEADRTAIVAVLGGSMASEMTKAHGSLIERALAKRSCFEGRNVKVVNLALPGVKQPQQLLTLEYFLSIGAVIDVAITLDGFNEVVLPVAENQRHGVFPFYPRNWKFHVSGLKDEELMRQVGEIEFARSLRTQLATSFSGRLLRYSATANTLWIYLDRKLDAHIGARKVELTLAGTRKENPSNGYLVRGPTRRYKSPEQSYDDLVAVWSRSTELMSKTSQGAGIAAFHFLQPNQRVPNSKPFAKGERERALPKREPYDKPAHIGYPLLIEETQRLSESGLPIDDLTMLFKDVEEPLYIDGCCHVNGHGSRLMAQAIARIIVERFEAGKACPRFE